MLFKKKCHSVQRESRSSRIGGIKIVHYNFQTSSAVCEKVKKNEKKGWFWRRKKNDYLNNDKVAILTPQCKNGMIIGGSKGFGFAAADELLSRGANKIVIADRDKEKGDRAVERLCDTYGKDRASFVQCDIRDSTLLEASFAEAICRHKVIHILFSDFDENQTSPIKNRTTSICGESDDNGWSNTRKASMIGLKFMGKKNGGAGGVIVNCASILGFMDWPQNPLPIYCKKEPVIEVTRSVAEEHPVDKNGVRFIALCPTNKPFEKISLPDFPECQNKNDCPIECIPRRKKIVGLALTHVMANALTGSTWLVPPFPSLYELPKLIHFPKNKDELVDPQVYEQVYLKKT
ncbi:uncharacterized protein LOC122510195 [Leptopilina heterotoma]|uniref:uncharacterized protein LOC122510195 n=1 Tax=Leptopilina heterotoma TaxID=63436 RepID=UPI001CA9F549|nr:uncharacterized protein LOC122510195 [Leptopilina heterotoma]